MLKRILTLIMTGLLVMVMAAGAAWAKTGGGPPSNPGNSGGKAVNQVDKGGPAANKAATVKPDKRPQTDGAVTKAALATKDNSAGNTKIKAYKESYKSLVKSGVTSGVKFKDVRGDHWAAGSIQKMSALGLFSGYGDGSFGPENNISQAELVALVMRLVEVTGTGDEVVDEDADEEETAGEVEDTEENVDEDVEEEEESGEDATEEEDTEDDVDEEEDTENDVDENADDEEELDEVPAWVREQVRNAAQMRIINMNRFHSHVQASRAQAAVILAKSLGLEPVDTTDMPFTDSVLISAEDAGYIMALYQEGLISGMPGGKFNPNSAITRAQIAVLLERVLADAEENAGEDEAAEEEEAAEEDEKSEEDVDEE